MDNDEYFMKLIEEAEQKALEVKAKDKLIDVFRSNYDGWTKRLFPAWRKAEVTNCHHQLALHLQQRGFVNVSENQVAKYMKQVRDERSRKGVVQKKEILKATSQGVTPTTSSSENFVPVDRDWRAVEKLAKESTEWSSDLEGAWNHLKWLADERKIPPAARPLMDTWLNLGGEPMKSAWLQLKRRRRENSLPVEI